MGDIRIIKTICALSETKDGWQKELNIVSIDGGPFQYDIREWRLNHFDYRDGISLDEKEATELLFNLRKAFGLKDTDLDTTQIEMPVVEKVFVPAVEQKPNVLVILAQRGISFIDKREHGGALWVVGDHSLDNLMTELKGLGFSFSYSEKGGRITKYKPGWFMR